MTGEISLRGRVLAIGGLKEKLLAASRAGVKTVLIPEENEKDLADVPENILNKLEVIPLEHVDEVLKHALTGPLTPIEWNPEEEALKKQAPTTETGTDDPGSIVTH
jgi:ATP-dependent Lon protease